MGEDVLREGCDAHEMPEENLICGSRKTVQAGRPPRQSNIRMESAASERTTSILPRLGRGGSVSAAICKKEWYYPNGTGESPVCAASRKKDRGSSETIG